MTGFFQNQCLTKQTPILSRHFMHKTTLNYRRKISRSSATIVKDTTPLLLSLFTVINNPFLTAGVYVVQRWRRCAFRIFTRIFIILHKGYRQAALIVISGDRLRWRWLSGRRWWAINIVKIYDNSGLMRKRWNNIISN